MIRRTTVNLTQATDRQVEALQEAGFGSFTEIVRIAIDRMYRDELHALEGKLHQVARVAVEYSEDGLFGAEGSEGYDPPASFARFEELLDAAISRQYPDAEISIRNGIGDWHQALDAQGLEINTETEILGGIIYAVHSDDEWLIKS